MKRLAAHLHKTKRMENKAKKLVFFKGLIKALAIVGLTIMLLVQGSQRIDYYLQVPTYISSSVVKQQDATFPTFTICPESSFAYKEDVITKHGYTHYHDYNCGGKGTSRNKPCPFWITNSSTENISPYDFFEEITHSVTEMIESITVHTLIPDTLGGYKMVLEGRNLEKNVETQYHRPFGRCYTLSLEENIRQKGVRYLELKMIVYGKVYFHPPGQYISLNGRMGYKIKAKDYVEATLNYHEYRMLEKDNPNYDPNAEDQNRFKTTCNPGEYNACMYDTLTKLMMNEVGCTVPYLPNVKDKICTDYESARKAFDIHWFRVTNQQHDCQAPCTYILTELSKSSNYYTAKTNDNSTIFKVYFQENISLSKEDYIFPFLSLVADLGAYLTILLGVSLLDAISFMYKCLEKAKITMD